MKVHLRLTEKDVDLCRWRHSIKWGMMTFYVKQILTAEINGQIAYLPTALRVSAKTDPCDVYLIFNEEEIIEYLETFPARRRNALLKKIIRKHLRAQTGQIGEFVYHEPAVKEKVPSKPKSRQVTSVKEEKKPVNNEPRKEIVESEEDRAAILALIAMGGE